MVPMLNFRGFNVSWNSIFLPIIQLFYSCAHQIFNTRVLFFKGLKRNVKYVERSVVKSIHDELTSFTLVLWDRVVVIVV